MLRCFHPSPPRRHTVMYRVTAFQGKTSNARLFALIYLALALNVPTSDEQRRKCWTLSRKLQACHRYYASQPSTKPCKNRSRGMDDFILNRLNGAGYHVLGKRNRRFCKLCANDYFTARDTQGELRGARIDDNTQVGNRLGGLTSTSSAR